MMPRHSVAQNSRAAFCMNRFLEIAAVEAVDSISSWRSAKAGVPGRPYVSWDRGTERHDPVPVRPYLPSLNAPQSTMLQRQPQRT